MTNKLNNTLSGLRGRFFGITTNKGEVLNAQLIRQTPKYIEVWDRNTFSSRLFAKTSIDSISVGGKRIKMS